MTTLSEDQSAVEVGIEEDGSVLITDTGATMASAAPRGSKNGRLKKSKGKTQDKISRPKMDVAPPTSSFIEPEDDDFAVKVDVGLAKKTRGKKRTSDDTDSESALIGHADTGSANVGPVAPPAKRRATRDMSSTLLSNTMHAASTQEGHDPELNVTDSEAMPPPSFPLSKKCGKGSRKRASSTARKASGASNASKASLRATIPDDEEIDAALEADLDRPLTDEEDVPEHVEVETSRVTRTRNASQGNAASKAPVRKKTRASKNVAAPKKDGPAQLSSSPVPMTEVEQPAPVSASPSRSGIPASLQPLPAPASVPSPPRPQQAVPSPTPSPQSSDAENQPPSSRPLHHRPPLTEASPSTSQTSRVPLTASTPNASPSKRNPSSRLQTTCEWIAVNLETVFRDTLSSNNENKNPSAPRELHDIEKVTLGSPEKKMTVEEWVYYNARKGEERLRDECERLVGKFEGEGVRAMRALEGIICAE